MKKIFVVSLDDEVPLTEEVKDSIKVLCFLVYDDIQGIEYDAYKKILYRDDSIKYNELREKNENGIYTHRFVNNNPATGEYEPFMISDRAFAFTTNDDLISAKEIANIITIDRAYVNIPGKFNIDSVTYEEDAKNKNRLLAIKKILTKEEPNKEDIKPKTKVKSIIPILGL